MQRHVKVVSYAWAIAGFGLIAWALWGLMTESHFRSVVESWLTTLAFGMLAIVASIAFVKRTLSGRVLIRLVSVVALFYSAAWLLMGGAEEASTYWPGILVGTVLSIYALVIAGKAARAA